MKKNWSSYGIKKSKSFYVFVGRKSTDKSKRTVWIRPLMCACAECLQFKCVNCNHSDVFGKWKQVEVIVEVVSHIKKVKKRFDANLCHFEKGQEYVLVRFLETCGDRFVLDRSDSDNKYCVHLESFVCTPKKLLLECRASRHLSSRGVYTLPEDQEEMIVDSL